MQPESMQAWEEDLATSRQTLGPARSVLSVACRPSRGAKPKFGKKILQTFRNSSLL